MKARIAFLIAGLMILSSFTAHAGASCAGPTAGGEWRSFGGTVSNSRHQESEGTLKPAMGTGLTAKWIFNTTDADALGGSFSNTPIVADGCVFLASDVGRVFALNADTGDLVWKANPLVGSSQVLLGGVIVGSPVVKNGIVYVGVSRPGTPYVAALNEADGKILWTSVIETQGGGAAINASPVYYEAPDPAAPGGVRKLIFQGWFGGESQGIGSASLPVSRGGFAILDASADCDATAMPTTTSTCATSVPGASGGARYVHTYTISDAEYAAGYRGASVWCSAAYDPDTLSMYACGGNPASNKLEARYANSLFKVDADPTSASFGKILAAHKGDPDQYLPGVSHQPLCDQFGGQLVAIWSAGCAQLDLDFGASPNLFTDSLGRKMIGDLQKSGVYHAVYADNMEQAWTQIVGTPCFCSNAGSPAFDNTNIFAVATEPGQVVALSRADGRVVWAAPFGAGLDFQPVTVANGVVYIVDNASTINAWDAATGMPIVRHPIALDIGTTITGQSSNGIAVARGALYVASSSYVIAYGS